MSSDALVQLALAGLSCSQKELALRLGVSPTQISKWKKSEHMSYDMENKLRALAGIGLKNPEFVLWAGSLAAANKWDHLIHVLADRAMDDAETGYITEPLEDNEGQLCWLTFHTLREMGVEIPESFPKALDFSSSHDEDEGEERWDAIQENPHASLIYAMFGSLNDVYGFYAAYISELMSDLDLDLYSTEAANIEPCLLELAAAKLDEVPQAALRFGQFKRATLKNYKSWLGIAKDTAFRAGVPLRAELLDMIHESSGALGHQAEAESLGFNASRIHPDIYMNELLTGMRVIHQVLPAIMKKMGIYEEFELDTSELRIG